MVREEALSSDEVWAGLVTTGAGTVSGWHHHGENESVVYVLKGTFRVDFGPNGSEAVEGRAGDFVIVPPRIVHREANPSEVDAELVVFRAGTGPSTINVDGPEA